jgi:dTDP-4-dehydrorhamnose 3,5-epimerase
VKLDHWDSPSKDLPLQEFILDSDRNYILHVPEGYATGLQANAPNSKLMVFSDFTLEESANDDFRFDKELWYNWNITNKN